jgi:hypothetical protein
MAQSDQANQSWKLYRQLVERAWTDAAFRERLRADTKGTLEQEFAAAGLTLSLPDQVKLVESTDKVAHFTIPVQVSGGIVIC